MGAVVEEEEEGGGGGWGSTFGCSWVGGFACAGCFSAGGFVEGMAMGDSELFEVLSSREEERAIRTPLILMKRGLLSWLLHEQ